MLGGLTVMLDPRIHDSRFVPYPGADPESEVQEILPKGDEQQIILEYLGRMLKNIKQVDANGNPTGKTVPPQEIERLLAELLAISEEEWEKKGLYSPRGNKYFNIELKFFEMPLIDRTYVKAISLIKKQSEHSNNNRYYPDPESSQREFLANFFPGLIKKKSGRKAAPKGLSPLAKSNFLKNPVAVGA